MIFAQTLAFFTVFTTFAGALPSRAQEPCAAYRQIEQKLQTLSWEEIRERLEEEQTRLGQAVPLKHAEKKAIRAMQKQVDQLLALGTADAVLTQIRSSACPAPRKGPRLTGLKLTVSRLNQSLLIPFRWIALFTKEMIWPEKNPFPEYALPAQIGNELRESEDIVDLELTPFYNNAYAILSGGGNPLTLPLMALPLYDYWMHRACLRERELGVASSAFCERLRKVDQSFDRAALSGFKLAKKILQAPYEGIDFKSASDADAELCRQAPRRQMQAAEKRLQLFKEALVKRYPQIKSVELIPPGLDGCVRYHVELEKNAAPVTLGDSTLAGVGVVSGEVKPYQSNDHLKGAELMCQEFHEYGIGGLVEAKTSQAFTLVRAMANPERVTPLSLEPIVTQKFIRPAGPRAERAVILIPKPEPGLEAEAKKFERSWDPNQQEFKQLIKQVRGIYRGFNSYSACLQSVRDSHFDVARFQELSAQYENFKKYQIFSELSLYRKQLKQFRTWMFFFDGTRLGWEVKEGGTAAEILKYLQDPTIAHLVIVGHGKGSNGKIVDPSHDVIPPEAFNSISPELRSLSLFNCFSQAAIQTYHLRQNLSQAPSRNTQRYLGSVGIVDGYENYAIANTLSHFMKRLDDRLAQADRSEARRPSQAPDLLGEPAAESRVCRIAVENVKVSSGSFSIHVGQRFYGVIHPSAEPRFEFMVPCAEVRFGATLYLRGASAKGLSTLDLSENTRVVLYDDSGTGLAQPISSPMTAGQAGLQAELKIRE